MLSFASASLVPLLSCPLRRGRGMHGVSTYRTRRSHARQRVGSSPARFWVGTRGRMGRALTTWSWRAHKLMRPSLMGRPATSSPNAPNYAADVLQSHQIKSLLLPATRFGRPTKCANARQPHVYTSSHRQRDAVRGSSSCTKTATAGTEADRRHATATTDAVKTTAGPPPNSGWWPPSPLSPARCQLCPHRFGRRRSRPGIRPGGAGTRAAARAVGPLAAGGGEAETAAGRGRGKRDDGRRGGHDGVPDRAGPSVRAYIFQSRETGKGPTALARSAL